MKEFELIARLTKSLPTNKNVLTGAGDDCAVLDLGVPDRLILFKTCLLYTSLEEQKNPAARSQIQNQWATFLIAQLQDKEMETAARELLRQAVVMIWGAFEVLCRDVFVEMCIRDRNPRILGSQF